MILSLWCQLPVCLTTLVGLTLVVIYPPCVGVFGVTLFQWHPMNFPWGDHFPGQLQLRKMWCIPNVQASCLNVGGVTGGLLCIQWWFMLMQSAHLCGYGGMQRQDLFSWSGCVLTAIWFAWLQSCGVSWGGMICRNMVSVCLSRRGYLPIGLMVLGRISHGLCSLFYKAPPSYLLKTAMLPLAGWLLRCWYDRLNQWREVGPNRDTHISPFIFLNLWHWYLS